MTFIVTYTNGKTHTYKDCSMAEIDTVDFAYAQRRKSDGQSVWDFCSVDKIKRVEILVAE